MEKKYVAFGLLPMTKIQLIDYMKSGNFLTKRADKQGYELTGGVPYVGTDGKEHFRAVVYNSYEHLFSIMLRQVEIREAYVPA